MRRLLLVFCAVLAACGDGPESAPDLLALENKAIALLEQYEEKPMAEAVALFSQVVEAAPGWRDARVNLAIALAATKGADALLRASDELERVLAEDPRHAHALFHLALVKRFQGKPDEAMPYLERLLAVDPDEPSVHYWLGTVEQERSEGNPAVAETHFRRALELDPNDQSSIYSLFRVLMMQGLGDEPEALALHEKFKRIETAQEFGSPALVKHRKRGDGEYGEGGKYAFAIRDLAAPVGSVFVDATAASGLGGLALGKEPGLACGDADGDGDDDLFFVDPERPAALLRNDGGRFADATAGSGLAEVRGRVALFLDLDDDGRSDLAVAGDAIRLFRASGPAAFEEVPASRVRLASKGPFAGLCAADVDHDGDLDLAFAGAESGLLRNNRDGSFDDVSRERNVRPGTTLRVLALDGNGDSVTDLLWLFDPDAPGGALLVNRRLEPFESAVWEPEGDGPLPGFVPTPARWRGSRGAAVADFDADGAPDVLGFGEHTTLHRATPGGGYRPEGLSKPDGTRSALALADFDGDHDLDVVLAGPGSPPALLRNDSPRSNHVLHLRLRGVPDRVEGKTWSNVRGVGAEVEVKAGDRIATQVVRCGSGFPGQATTDLFFGLGERTKADYVRVRWTDGVLQSEFDVPAGRVHEIVEVNRKLASCPILFAWNGESFGYVTDTLGVGGLGFYLGPSIGYAPPDPTEVVRIGAMEPKDGEYLVLLTENLEEVSYLDEARLLVVDHPASMEVHPDERFAAEPPWPQDRIHGAEDRIFPAAATDDEGRDVLPLLLEDDRRTVATFRRDPRFVGMAEPHALVLDFGDRLRGVRPGDRLVMFLSGWVEYGYSKTAVGASQAGLTMEPPVLEVPDGRGGWKKAAVIGYPAGNARTMTFDATGILGPLATRCRIRTNLEVYWDRVFVAPDAAPGRIRVRSLEPRRALLREIGYPREYSPDGRAPALYDRSVCEAWIPFRTIPGDYTHLGEVTELAGKADDRFVIFGKGEEVLLAFAAGLDPPAEGSRRTFLVRLDGYCKDKDPYTAHGDAVEPLPFHAMTNYPYGAGERYPDDPAHREYRLRWNTRRVR